jgi:hypothetical protein
MKRLSKIIDANGREIDSLSFDSFHEAITAARSDFDVTAARGSSRRESSGAAWDANTSFDGAILLAEKGWPEGRDMMAAFASKLDVSGMVAKPEIVYDVIGNGGIDMGRYMTGEPECMIDWLETDVPLHERIGGKIIHIVVNMAASAGISANIMQRRGAAVMALVDALEQAGKRVDITLVECCAEFQISIPIKSAEYQPQADQIAFALVHPAMLRRIGFSLTAQCGEGGLNCAKGHYGVPSNNPHGDLYIPSAYYGDDQWSSDTKALAWVKQILTEQGVTLETTDKKGF